MSDDKKDEIATLAVCAKLEKAIGRRLMSQDASFTRKEQAQVSELASQPKPAPVMDATKPVPEKAQ